MVAVEQPRADCGHLTALTQQCGKCLRWCCPECYAPWTALACGDCRAEARAAAANPYSSEGGALRARLVVDPAPRVETPTGRQSAASECGPVADARCRERSRVRRPAGPGRHREPADVRMLAARVADLERRLQQLRPGN